MAFKFILQVKDGFVNQDTVITSKKRGEYKITNGHDLCVLIYRNWLTSTNSKNYQDWCDDLNESGDYKDGEWIFRPEDAFEHMCSNTNVNVSDGGKMQPVNLLKYFQEHCPKLVR